MRDSVYKIWLDVHNETPQVQLTAKKGDNARSIHMYLTEYGKPWTHPLDGTVRAVLTVKTPDGTTLTNNCDIYDDKIVYGFTALTVKEVGVDECELIIYDGETTVLTSPRFTILVDETVFEHGQTIGAAWKEALDEAKAQIKETTDALDDTTQYLKTRTQSMTLNYATVADMAADGENLSDGMVCATKGRWVENDMGARTYRITTDNKMSSAIPVGSPPGKYKEPFANPLAIKVRNADPDNNVEALYAVPIITDYVTVLDIGLRRGLLEGEEYDKESILYDEERSTPKEETLDLSEFDDDSCIPAVNSRLLQNYVRNLECFGFEENVDDSAMYNRIARVHFPPGVWAFRDPIVVGASVRFTGESVSPRIRQSIAKGTAYGTSRIIFVGGELTLTDTPPTDVSVTEENRKSYRTSVWKAKLKLPGLPKPTSYITGEYPDYNPDSAPTGTDARRNPSYLTALKNAAATLGRIATACNVSLDTLPVEPGSTSQSDMDTYTASLVLWLRKYLDEEYTGYDNSMAAKTAREYYIKRQTESGKTGDEGYDQSDENVNNRHESVYMQYALFYIRGTACSFEHLEISTPKFFEFIQRGGAAFARDPADLGKRYNPYLTLRRQKGICGIRCQGPGLVDESNAARPRYNVNVSADTYGRLTPTVELLGGSSSGLAEEYGGGSDENASTNSGMRLLVKECNFYCFPYAALIAGRLSEVERCRFSDNHFAISEIGADHWIRGVYMQHSFCGIVTNSHTTHVYDAFIDMLSGFGIVSGISVGKKTVFKDSGNNVVSADMEDITLRGTLLGDFHGCFDTSGMGAIGAFRAAATLRISGKIGDCGLLYQRAYTRIFDYSVFRTHTMFLKVKDSFDDSRANTASWDSTNNRWTGTAVGSDETLGDFKTAYKNLRDEYESNIRNNSGLYHEPHIILYPHFKSYYSGEAEWEAGDEDMAVPEDPYTSDTTPDDVIIKNRQANFYSLIGTAGINIAGIFGGLIDADYQPRTHWAYLNGKVSNNKISTPIYGLNAINVRSLTMIGCTPDKRELDPDGFMLGVKNVQGLDNTMVVNTRSTPYMRPVDPLQNAEAEQHLMAATISVKQYDEVVSGDTFDRNLVLKFDENNGATRQVAVSGYVNVTEDGKTVFTDVGMPLYPAPNKIMTLYAAADYTDTTNNTSVKIGYPVATLYLVQKMDRMSVNGITNYKGPVIGTVG